ncbi:uncharacterized protein MAL8P1.12-like [Leptopilina boulardi]|uniref:uncharacterized protein MAL8P1.12-like n=1 Tax=Leptopilina boulardi TaxID=63433 RepID=UPI0021F5CEBB|nr:uncharacterized protein MAL8P1.12-like [Leptopilina boulardi]XP_051173738.1 uncharacterized protein MAL8P1.12-like [Leptopilina boulardi]
MSVVKKNSNSQVSSKIVNTKGKEKIISLSTFPHVISANFNHSNKEKKHFNYRSPNNGLPSISIPQHYCQLNSSKKFQLNLKNKNTDESNLKFSSPTINDNSNWQKLRQRNLNKINNEKNMEIKEICKNFDQFKLHENFNEYKINNKKNHIQSLIKKNSKTNIQTYRILKIAENKGKNINLKINNNSSNIGEYFAKFGQNIDQLKNESNQEISSSINKEKINDLFKEINILEIGFDLPVKKYSQISMKKKSLDQESQSSNRLSFKEKEKILKKLITSDCEYKEENNDTVENEVNNIQRDNSTSNMLKRILKSDYLKHQLNL